MCQPVYFYVTLQTIKTFLYIENKFRRKVGAKFMPKGKNSLNSNENDSVTIEEICKTTWKPLYRFIYYKVQNQEEAEEITQEAYVKAIPHLQNGRIPKEKNLGFLKTVALNILRDSWRKKKRRGTSVQIESINPLENAVNDDSEFTAQRLLIENALTQLTEEQRTVIELRILKGYSVADAAKIMHKNEGNIRVIQYRALRSLAKIIKTTN